ncbi:hypothetical protein DPMN_185999 [Dreissena polymorpha]|uniref:Uncharacterized protein n=1 Tax=Dreissena polymorpha TaxID=45954 RepID=A0A9D4DMK1_DREPO|nr:hypothetical protein DPMN_185999 [Dreissena polymorpha]
MLDTIALKYVTSRVLTRKISLHLDTCSNNKDWTINVTSNAITQFNYRNMRKTAMLPCIYIFQQTRTIFQLSSGIMRTNVLPMLTTKNVPPSGNYKITNVLSKFHYNLTINVTSRVETGRPTDGSVFQPTRTIF